MPSLFAYATASPMYSIEQPESAALAQALGLSQRWNKALPALYQKSGVSRRGSVLLVSDGGEPMSRQDFYKPACDAQPFGPTTSQRMQIYAEHAGELLRQSCQDSLHQAEIRPDEVTHLVTVSCTGFCAPGIDHELIDTLGLSVHIQRTHVGFMGCHGLVNGVRVANAIAQGDSTSVVLVGAVELCSIHQQYSEDPQQMVANSLFADGAASGLVASTANHVCRNKVASGWSIVSSFSHKIEGSRDFMGWLIGDHGFRMQLSPEVPSIIEKQLRVPFTHWIESNGLTKNDVQGWAVHPGGPRILDAVETAMELDKSHLKVSRSILENHGNMSSPTILFVLRQLEKERDGLTNCVLLGFGPGLHVEAILLKRSRI